MVVRHIVVALMIGSIFCFMACAILTAGKISDLQNELYRSDNDDGDSY
jgi:hypothetical protein